jgi:hypothetical protein
MAETKTAEAEASAEPQPNLSTIPAGTDPSDVVKPVALAAELNIRPQIVFGWIRNSNLPSYKDEKGKNVILRSEFATWNAEREEKRQAREAKKAEKAAAAASGESTSSSPSGETSSEDPFAESEEEEAL